ncbi:MAG TPA: hypothetical protein V6D14_14340 [Coleofasciculaceae cyanobacterium]
MGVAAAAGLFGVVFTQSSSDTELLVFVGCDRLFRRWFISKYNSKVLKVLQLTNLRNLSWEIVVLYLTTVERLRGILFT